MVWQIKTPAVLCVTAQIGPGSGNTPKMVKDNSYLRCTPLGHLFGQDTKKRKAHLLLHSESKQVHDASLPDFAGMPIIFV